MTTMTTMTTAPLAIARPPAKAYGQSSIIHSQRRQALTSKLRQVPAISTFRLFRPRSSHTLLRSLAADPSSPFLEEGEEEDEEEEKGCRVGAEEEEGEVDERKPRLKPFWFFLSILKKWSSAAAWMDNIRFRPSKKLGFSIFIGCVLVLACGFLKVTATESPQVVPYSNLVEHLQEGKVEAALFEEGSRHILFNLRPLDEEPNSLEEATIPLKVASISPETATNVPTVATISSEMATKAPEVATISPQKATQGPKESPSAPSMGAIMPQIALTSGPCARILSLIRKMPPAKLLTAEKRPPKQWQFSTRRIKNDESYLLGLMRGQRISYSSAPQPMSAALRTVLITIISLWIPLTPLLWLMHRQLSGGYGSQKKRLSPQSVKFEDVAGVDEAKNELMEVVSCLRGATKFKRLGATLPKGVLLVGPPGTGKTLLARAVAGEAGVPFLAVSASEFVEMFVGRGAARVRELFATARKNSPSIVFIDELDAVGGHRGRSFNDERDQTLNQLLTEMDGFESDSGVLVIAATNRAEALDAALCRPGRFSRKVYVKQPDADGRWKILAVHMRGIPVQGSRDAICDAVSRNTDGFVGADLANLVNEAAFLAARRESSAVSVEDFKEAIGRVKYGVGSKSGVGGGLGRVEREISRWFGRQLSNIPPNEQSLLGYQAASWSG